MTRYIVAAACILLLTVEALAVEPSLPRNPKIFAKLDSDSNGKITLEEIRPKAETRLLRLDTDNDKEVSAGEIDAYINKALERRKAQVMTSLDQDKSGSITVAELDNFLEALFNGADADKDGGVTLEEARKFRYLKWRRSFLETKAN